MIDLSSVKDRLLQLGYTSVAGDDALINYVMVTVQNSIKVTLNISAIPEDVEHIIIDKIVGEFLLNKKSTGQDIGLEVDAFAKSIQEGDTTVQYDVGASPEARLNTLIKWLMNGRNDVLMRYRRLVW